MKKTTGKVGEAVKTKQPPRTSPSAKMSLNHLRLPAQMKIPSRVDLRKSTVDESILGQYKVGELVAYCVRNWGWFHEVYLRNPKYLSPAACVWEHGKFPCSLVDKKITSFPKTILLTLRTFLVTS